MHVPRAAHTSTLLADGQVLVAGGCTGNSCEMSAQSASAELFDPATGRFTFTGKLTIPRVSHTATRLNDGRVLIAGGWTIGRVVESAEIYDPRTRRFEAAQPMQERRSGHTATLLNDGRILVTGGTVREGTALASAEVFNPAKNTFTAVGDMLQARAAHVSVRLVDGRVLIAGGHADRSGAHRSLELFDPVTGRFTSAGTMTTPRNKLAAQLLASGRVLLMGGTNAYDRDVVLSSAEIYDARTGSTRLTGPMTRGRYKFTDAVTRLNSGQIFVAGGSGADVFVEARNRFELVPGTLGGGQFTTATALTGDAVLIVGGYDLQINPTNNAWVYRPNTAP